MIYRNNLTESYNHECRDNSNVKKKMTLERDHKLQYELPKNKIMSRNTSECRIKK